MAARTPRKRFSSFLILIPVYAALAVLFAALIRNGHMQLLEPAGYIADIQSRMIWAGILFAGVVAIIMIITFFYVVFRYREGKHARYEPEWTGSNLLHLAGWGVPFIVVCLISVLLWNTAHQVDPYQPIASATQPLTIQVVALRWKWLFLYPNDHIATVNTLEIPVGTPVALQLSADAPMNSFWVPRLSGQVFAMTGMVTQLHIQADKTGTYAGSSAEISGDEFASMDFSVKAVSAHDFDAWKANAQHAKQSLDYAAYLRLAEPSGDMPPATYALADKNLFDVIVMKYMEPGVDPSAVKIKGESL